MPGMPGMEQGTPGQEQQGGIQGALEQNKQSIAEQLGENPEENPLEQEAPTPGPLNQGSLGPRMKSLYPWRVGPSGDREVTIDGIKIVVANLTREVGKRHWNLGVVDKNGKVEWVESGSTLAEMESWIPQVIEGEKEYRGKKSLQQKPRPKVKSFYERVMTTIGNGNGNH